MKNRAFWRTACRLVGLAVLIGFGLGSGPGDLQAQDEPELGWFYTAEMSLLFTSGNSDAQTFGFGGGLRRVWENSEFSLRAGSLRTETGTKERRAVGTADDFVVSDSTESALTAENYFVTASFDRSLSETFFFTLGAGWERNTFAGFDSRFRLVAALGNTWADNESTRFKTDYGLTFTHQKDVVSDPSSSSSFAGLQVSAEFWRQLTSSTAFESVMIVDESLQDTDDLRADWTNSVVIEISNALAFKASMRLLYDHLPAQTSVGLELPLGTPTGETVLVPLNELDTIFTIALVASF